MIFVAERYIVEICRFVIIHYWLPYILGSNHSFLSFLGIHNNQLLNESPIVSVYISYWKYNTNMTTPLLSFFLFFIETFSKACIRVRLSLTLLLCRSL